jgi:hypothetical protein
VVPRLPRLVTVLMALWLEYVHSYLLRLYLRLFRPALQFTSVVHVASTFMVC